MINVLFWVGYQRKKFNSSDTKGLAGSEIAVVEVTNHLAAMGLNVFVSGDVIPGKLNNVTWVDRESIHNLYFNKFDIIIGTSYLHIVKEFENYNKAKLVFWAHNTDYHPYWNGKEYDFNYALKEHTNLLSKIVCVSEWHKKYYTEKYKCDKPIVINNGINTNSFIKTNKKDRNSFLWSSALDRGVIDLVKHWHMILECIPSAKLNICYPEYSKRIHSNILDELKKYECDSIKIIGTVDQNTLHRLMMRSEYWCYVTDYKETYCITALEMQYSKVIPIVTNVAALNETVPYNIKVSNDRDRWLRVCNILIHITETQKKDIRRKNYMFAKQNTWHMRALEWKELIKELNISNEV